MRRHPALTLAGALKILGKHDPTAIGRLDKALGGAILAAGAGVGIAAVGGVALAPLGLVAALWGWVDQKNEAIGILRGLTSSLSNHLAKTRGLERRDLIVAAHSTIVAAAFFEVLDEALRKNAKKLAITNDQRCSLIAGTNLRETQSHFELLYTADIPAPSPSCGFQENIQRIVSWLVKLQVRTEKFVDDVNAGEHLIRLFTREFTERVQKRYESHYLHLAERVPEFLIWAILGEHAATRERITTLDDGVRAALETHGGALARVEALLELMVSPGADPGLHRENLNKVNRGVLELPIVPSDAERYDADVVFPTIRDAFLAPRYRIELNSRGARPADENWWAGQPSAHDLDVMITAYLTSADAIRVPLLLLGHPGAGKSMLTKVLAARLPPTDYTVVRVPLRNVGAGAPVVDQIQQALDAATNKRVKWHLLSDESVSTVLLVLLDGLDELLQATTSDRTGYLQEVMEFQRIEGQQDRPVAVVVTSRTVVADRVDIPLDVPIVKLDEFDDDQIAAWLDNWRDANAVAIAAGTVRELTAAEAHHQIDLARQPLLLLMLALYAADPKSPKLDVGLSRSALYHRIFDNFAHREVLKRAMTVLHGKALNQAVEEQVFRLSVAALAMFNRGVQYLRENELRTDLAAISGSDNLADDEGKRVLGEFFFVHAAEGLMLIKERSYEFLHATFGEYLVAQHVMNELVDSANAAYSSRYRERIPDDEMLFALLSHQPWQARPSIIGFAKEIFAAVPDYEQANVRRALRELIRSYRQRRRGSALDAYRPVPLDFVRQLAAYSANLVTLTVAFGDEPSGLRQVGPFGGTKEEALRNWQSTMSLWRSGLDRDSWQAMLFSLDAHYVDGWGGMTGVDEFLFAVLCGDTHHANRVRLGIGHLDRHIFHFNDEDWTEGMLSWINPAILTGLGAFVIEDPPIGADEAGVARVGNALSMLLRLRSAELEFDFVKAATVSIMTYPEAFEIRVETILAVAYFHPRVLLETPQWHNRDLYAGLNSELHIVLDHAAGRLDRGLRGEWQRLRSLLLGTEIAEVRAAQDDRLTALLIDMLTNFDQLQIDDV